MSQILVAAAIAARALGDVTTCNARARSILVSSLLAQPKRIGELSIMVSAFI